MEQKKIKIELNTIIDFLFKIDFFKTLSQAALQDFASSLEPVYVEGGTTIIHEEDFKSNLFILYEGRLRVYKRLDSSPLEKEVVLAEISVGQFVGEISLLTQLHPTSTVRAVRDSILFKLDEKAFAQFEKNHPHEVVNISKTALKRLVTKSRPTQIGENVTNLAIAPAGHSNHRLLIERLVKELNKIKPTILVNQETCLKRFGKIFSPSEFEESHLEITEWLHLLENQYGYVIYETDPELTPWTQRCIRQADRLLFVVDPQKPPILNSIETMTFSDKNKLLPYIEMVFVHPDNQIKIIGTDAWLKDRMWDGFHHLNLTNQPIIDKFIRFLTGRCLGVILNGGGTRGFAHAGILKALDELQIPIDFIAGTSFGSIVVGAYASGGIMEVLKIDETYQKNFVISESLKAATFSKKNFVKDWTLPFVSLLKGKVVCAVYQNMWKNTRIEDLWIRFFCVSTNVTKSQLQIHDKGELWLAVRASTSLPAVYPPIYNEEGDMLVDGGMMNNMPVDIMRKMICGGKILAVNCNKERPAEPLRKYTQAWISGWKLFFQRFNPFYKKVDYDSLFYTLIGSMNISSAFKQKQMGKEADFLIEIDTSAYTFLDFAHANELIELGYRTGMAQLPGLLGLKGKKNHFDVR